MKKSSLKSQILLTCILLAASLLLNSAAVFSPAFANFYSRNIYSILTEIICRITGLVPFPVIEPVVCLLLFLLVRLIIRRRREPLRILSSVLLSLAVLLLLFVCNCGINYRSETFSESTGIEVREYSRDELYNLCRYLTDEVNRNAVESAPEGTADSAKGSAGKGNAEGSGQILTGMDLSEKKSWPEMARKCMYDLGEEYEVLSGYYPRPKPLTISRILSVQQVSGIYMPFTIEAIYNREMTDYDIPHTMCHELSHLRGYMHEDEANFLGYLGCISSESAAFRYSGYLVAWVYAGNALAEADPEAYRRLHDELCPAAAADLKRNNEFWARFDGKIAELQDEANDLYLKSNGLENGILSYNRFPGHCSLNRGRWLRPEAPRSYRQSGPRTHYSV